MSLAAAIKSGWRRPPSRYQPSWEPWQQRTQEISPEYSQQCIRAPANATWEEASGQVTSRVNPRWISHPYPNLMTL
ncbi:MAG: hypothetical protein LBH11_06015, partial [Propionibacteriaceae bacterium]|nr:hypothetical protein [Propionibacteriaceae bacterium]